MWFLAIDRNPYIPQAPCFSYGEVQLIKIAKAHNCQTVVFEHLGKLKTPKYFRGAKKLRKKLHYWMQGRIQRYTRYKANAAGYGLKGHLSMLMMAVVRLFALAINSVLCSWMAKLIMQTSAHLSILALDTGLERF